MLLLLLPDGHVAVDGVDFLLPSRAGDLILLLVVGLSLDQRFGLSKLILFLLRFLPSEVSCPSRMIYESQ